jgi:hypothetical protein
MTRAEKITVWGSTAVMTITGVAIAWMEYVLEPADAFAVVNHPWQPVLLKVHILSAPVMVFGIGMIFLRHIWPHFRTGLKKGRRSGIWSMVLTIPMIVTGYALQVMSNVGWLTTLGYIHFALGSAFAVGGALHFLATRRSQRRSANAVKDKPAFDFPAKRRRVSGL